MGLILAQSKAILDCQMTALVSICIVSAQKKHLCAPVMFLELQYIFSCVSSLYFNNVPEKDGLRDAAEEKKTEIVDTMFTIRMGSSLRQLVCPHGCD